MYDGRYEKWVRELVREVSWNDVTVIELSDSEDDSGTESGDESEYDFYHGGIYLW